jgi:hypothetical protein
MLLLLLPSTTPIQKFEFISEKDYQTALNFLSHNKSVFIKYLSPEEREVLVPTIFPELVRYSEIRDLIEDEAMQMIYAEQESNIIDFSIGKLQMKPSFIIRIENYIFDYPELKEFNFIKQYHSSIEEAIRKERLERLNKLDWQVKYLKCFGAVVKHKFGDEFNSIEDKIRFYASAYNLGFHFSKDDIINQIQVRTFPYGKFFGDNQLRYSDISVSMYLKNYQYIFKESF